MSKLEFRYGAMNSGKSMELMRIAYNYNENNKKVVIIKSQIDTKGNDYLVSRVGMKRKVDIFLKSNESLFTENNKDVYLTADAILVDEAQFMLPFQIDELWYISKLLDIPVICFGLKTDFTTNTFPGSKRLLELSDELIELETICSCGKKARFNARKVNDEYVTEGQQNVIDGSDNVEYVPLCGSCYIEKVLKKDKKSKEKIEKQTKKHCKYL